jgi:hypothetical protein
MKTVLASVDPVCGSSVDSSISTVLRNTFPLHMRHIMSSKDEALSRLRTPAMKLELKNIEKLINK